MSVHVFFAFSAGLAKPIHAPKGTLASILAHVEEVEETLGLKRTQFKNNPVHWDSFDPAYRAGFPDIEDKILCDTARRHNDWVRRLYANIERWAEAPVADGEEITPEAAAGFWHALQLLTVRPERWTADYYRNRMEHLYEVMRGQPSEGVFFDEEPLTPRQAGAVIRIFEFLDKDDLRLDVPKDCDRLASSYDGEYEWCERCGAVENDYPCDQKGCPVKERYGEEEGDEDA